MALTPESPDFPKAKPHFGVDAAEHADHDAVAYQHGMMAIEEQASTWSLFMTLFKWVGLSLGVSILFLVLWFKPNGSFMFALIVGVVAAAAGWWLLRDKPQAQ